MDRKLKKTKTSSRAIASPLRAGLLLFGSLALSFAAQADNAGALSLRIVDGTGTVDARDVPLQQIVDNVVAEANLRLIQHGALDGIVTVSLNELALPDLFDALLEDHSYQLFQPVANGDAAPQQNAVPGTLWVFSHGETGDPTATVFLEAVLFFGTVAEKKEALRELRRLRSDTAVESISYALQDPDERIRDAALDALAAIGSDAALAAIASTSVSGDAATRSEAVNALSSGNAASAMQYLEIVMADPDPRVRMAVVDAYADIPDEYAARAISRALEDPDEEVRLYALDALDEVEATTAFRALMQLRTE